MNYYTLLNVAPTANDKEIQKAYRKLVKRYHPDHLQQAPIHIRRQSEEKLKHLNIAYAILSNPVKRRDYDRVHGRQQTSQASTKRQTSQKKQTSHDAKNYRTSVQQNLAKARTEYLRYRQAISAIETQIMDRSIHLFKTAMFVGFFTSLGAAILFFTFSSLLRFVDLSTKTWSNYFIALILFIFQTGAVLVVMYQLEITFQPNKKLKGIALVGGSMLFSLFTVTSFTGLSFHMQATFWEPFVYALATHLLGCVSLSSEWLKPLFLKRRRLETKLAAAEETLNYFKNMLDQDTHGYRHL